MASRVGASLLSAAGLPQLITSSFADYEELAVSLAVDSDRLYEMRRHLETVRDNCAAFDTQRWVRNMEAGLQLAWRRHESGLGPDHVEVEDSAPVFNATESLL